MNTPLCSEKSWKNKETVNGTAPVHKRYLFLEVSTPWPYTAVDSPKVTPEMKEAIVELNQAQLPIRFQTFYSEKHCAPEGMRRLFYFTLPDPPNCSYEKQEYLVPEKECSDLIKAIAATKDDKLPQRFHKYLEHNVNAITDWFVCTHGSHDYCCGKFGASLYMEMKERYSTCHGDGAHRVWRVDHIGGHRFAPTVIEFPSGRFWGRLHLGMLDQLINQSGEFTTLLPYYRGWGALGKIEQLAEAEILKQKGWSVTQYRRKANIVLQQAEKTKVQIELYKWNAKEEHQADDEVKDVADLTFEVEMERSGTVEVSSCTGSTSIVDQYRVVKVEEVTAT